MVFYVNMSRLADYLVHAIGDIVYLLAIYLILPYRFILELTSLSVIEHQLNLRRDVYILNAIRLS